MTPEASQDRVGVQQPGAGCRELDGEREAIQAPADLGDGGRVVLGQREVAADRSGAIDEELHRGERLHLSHRGGVSQRRHGERVDPVLVLGAETQHRPARREDLQRGTAGQQSIEVGGNVHDLFEVVEHEESLGVADALDDDVQRRH